MMKRFILASFNICSAHFIEERYTEQNLCRIGAAISASGADVVALQEVDVGAARSDGVDMPARLAEMTGLAYHYFIKIRDFEGGEYGTAILSRFPILESATIHYPVRIATQGTSCGYCVLNADGVPATIFNTHLSVESEAANTETLCCLGDVLKDYLRTHQNGCLVCGDFNTSVEKVRQYLPWMNRAHEGLITYADRSIDHILYTGGMQVENPRTIDKTVDRTTDHRMLLCDVLL